jgi:hypothetical protein
MLTPITTTAARVLTLLALATTVAAAQEPSTTSRGWELRLPGGALIATGAQRQQLGDAHLTALQLSRTLGSQLAVTGTFGWARSQDRAAAGTPKLDVFTSDVGIESCFHEWFADKSVSFETFAGIGGGARSYNYRSLAVAASNNLAAYAAVGGELGMGRFAVRLEARDYMTGFKPLVGGGKSETRNDVVIMGALRFNRRSNESR